MTALALISCSTERQAAGGATGGTVIIEEISDADNLLPPFAAFDVSRLVDDMVFDRLADISNDLNTIGDKGFTPRLAKSWSWAPDSLSVAFSLDPAARWHDGTPVRAADVRFTFRVYTDKQVASSTAELLTNIDSVSVRDSLTPVFWFKRRSPEQFYDVAFELLIMPEHVYGVVPPGQLRTSELARRPVGSGPFRFSRWDPAVRIVMTADTANYRGRPKLDRVILSEVDLAAASAQVLTGQADFLTSFPWDQRSKLDSSKVAREIPIPQTGYAFMVMNFKNGKQANQPHPIFGDAVVRRAIFMGLDRDAMVKNVFGDVGRVGKGPFPRGLSTSDTTLKLPPFDTMAAKRLLDSAGWRAATPSATRVKNGKPLRFGLLVANSSFLRLRYGVLIQEQLRRIGVQVDLQPLDNNASRQRQQSSDFDATLANWTPDPGVEGAKELWATSSIGPHGNNIGRYSNPRVDALLDSAARAPTLSRARAFTSQAYQQIIDDVPAVWLYDVTFLGAVNRRITVTPMRADTWWSGLAEWSIPVNARIARDRIASPSGSQ